MKKVTKSISNALSKNFKDPMRMYLSSDMVIHAVRPYNDYINGNLPWKLKTELIDECYSTLHYRNANFTRAKNASR